MSRKVVFNAFGGADVLELVDVDPPATGPNLVRVRVSAAGAQPFDARYRAGLFGEHVPAHFPQGLGGEFAGVVDELGDGVTGVEPGQEVLGWVWAAAYADHVVVAADEIVPKPESMPWVEAGALSASGQTAHTALEELRVARNESVLIHAAAGGVGTYAVQIAVAAGATVVGTASERNHEYLRSLGAIPVTYGDGLADRVRAATPKGVDAALDAHGGDEAIQVSLDLVADRSRIGTLSAYAAAGLHGIQLIGTQRSAARLNELTDLYERGALKVFIDRTFPLEQAADAHRYVETGHARGKTVLTVNPQL